MSSEETSYSPSPPARGTTLPRLALRRPVTVLMALLALLVLGVISYTRIPLELLPSGFTPPFLYVYVPSLPAAPSDVEERLAVPVEEMLATVRGVRSLRTTANVSNAGFLLEFNDGTDMDLAYNQVQDRMERVVPSLDETAQHYGIWKWSPTDDPIIWIGLTTDDPDGVDPLYVESVLVPRIERVAGVSNVDVAGGPDPVVVIELNDRMVSAAGTNTYELIQRLGGDNFALAGGEIDAGAQRLPLRVLAHYESLEAIRAVPVGNGLRLGDVGRVYIEDRAEDSVYRVNQREGIFLGVYRESLANAVDVSAGVREAIEGATATDPRAEALNIHYFFDQGDIILDAIDNLRSTALWGGFFAVLVLGFFLRRVPMTLLVAGAIPMSMIMTLITLYFLGGTLNVLSLTGLMLTVGMVVDNSIVVVESIQRRRNLGLERARAAIEGAGDVAMAIVVATMTTVVVFLPLMLMSGNEMLSFFLKQIGLPVCVGLVSSLVVSLIFVPLATTYVRLEGDTREDAWLGWATRLYTRILDLALRRRADTALLGIAIVASVAIPLKGVPVSDQADTNINDFRIYVDLPAELSFEEKREVLLACEEALWADRDALYVEDLLVRMGGRWGWPQLRAFLVDPSERDATREELVDEAMARMPELPGVTYFADWGDQASGGGSVSVSLVGPETERLIALSDEVARRLRTIDGVTSVRAEANAPADEELHLYVDREAAVRHGLSTQMVGLTLDYALRGRRISDLRQGDRELSIYVQGDAASANDVDAVNALELDGLSSSTTLGNVSRWETHQGFRSIRRQDRRTMISLEIVSGRDDLEALSEEIDAALVGFEWPRGYGLEKGQRFDVLDEGAEQRNFALILAIVFVFLLMGILLESFVLPFSILLAVPFAFVGVYWSLFITQTPLDLMAFVGLVVLIGIVVNNAIVLVDLVAELRRQGQGRHEAMLEAGRQRLRPILMTAATTIFGIVPMALGTSSLIGIPYAPMGRAVIGGLLAATVLTLVVVPLFYTFLDDAAGVGRRSAQTMVGIYRGATSRRRSARAAPEARSEPDASGS